MAEHLFLAKPVLDAANRLVPNASGQVFAVTDTSFSTPLTITTLSGDTRTDLATGEFGVLSDFKLVGPNPPKVVVWRSGQYTVAIASFLALQSQVDLIDTRLMEVENLLEAGGGGGGGVDDAGLAALIGDPLSATGAALRARYGAGLLLLPLDASVPAGTEDGTVIVYEGDGPTPGPVVLARDTFERTLASGWGAAEIGGSWTVLSTAKTSVSAGRGRVQTVASETQGGILQGYSADDTEVHAVVALGNTAGARLARIQQRRQSSTVYHQLSVRQYGASHASTPGRVDVSFDESTYTTGLLTGVAADALVHIKSRVTGTAPTLRQAKVWLDGTPEPSAWSAVTSTATGPQSGGGYGGLYFYSTGSEPGTAQHSVDLYEVLEV